MQIQVNNTNGKNKSDSHLQKILFLFVSMKAL